MLMLLLLVSLLVGAATSALLIIITGGLVEIMPLVWREMIFISTVTVAVVSQVLYPSRRHPDINRQVPNHVFAHSEKSGTVRFGFELGLGWRTKLTTLAPQVMAVGLILLPVTTNHVMLACLGFGCGRFIHLGSRLWHGGGHTWDERLTRRNRLMPLSSIASMLGLVTVAVGSL